MLDMAKMANRPHIVGIYYNASMRGMTSANEEQKRMLEAKDRFQA